MGYLQYFPDVDSKVKGLRFGEAVRQLESLNQANFRGLATCCKDLQSEDRQARTYCLLRAQLYFTIGDAASLTRASVPAALPTLSQSRRVLNLIEAGEESLLSRAAALGQLDLASRALRCGADPNRPDCAGQTPLMKAASADHAPVVQLLLAEKANVNATDSAGQTALIRCAFMARTAMMKSLLDARASVNAQAPDGRTALIRAASGGHQAVTALLLKHHADPEIKDLAGETAFSRAQAHQHQPVLMLLTTATKPTSEATADQSSSRTACP
jgi:ankyrin repeat protein